MKPLALSFVVAGAWGWPHAHAQRDFPSAGVVVGNYIDAIGGEMVLHSVEAIRTISNLNDP